MKQSIKIAYNTEAKDKLLSGVEKIASAVKVTLGPSGKNVLIRNAGDREPFATKDGVTVAGNMKSDNEFEQVAIECMQSIANNADNKAGDGTTTATILAESLFRNGLSMLQEKTNVVDFKNGIMAAVNEVIEELKKRAIIIDEDYEQLHKVALIASNNDKEVADVVIDAFKVAGKQGIAHLKRSHTSTTYLSTVEGLSMETGYKSIYFVNDHKHQIVDFDNAYIYATNEKITSVTENFNALLQYVNQEQLPLVIICKDIDEAVQEMLIKNKLENVLKVCVCKAPGFGNEQIEELKDFGTIVGKEPFLEHELDFNALDKDNLLDYLPQVKQVIITDNRILIKEPIVSEQKSEEIEKAKLQKANALREQLQTQITEYEKSRLQMRISRLTNGIAYIHIGATSDIVYNEKKHRIQDALYSVKSASEEGVVPGGGYALLWTSEILKDRLKRKSPDYDKIPQTDYELGKKCLLDILFVPAYQILTNVGLNIDYEELKRLSWNEGFDARRKMKTNDLIGAGIIDAVKVTRVALENAASIVSMLLTTECVIIEDDAYSLQKTAQFG